jgi:hypothetical protein
MTERETFGRSGGCRGTIKAKLKARLGTNRCVVMSMKVVFQSHRGSLSFHERPHYHSRRSHNSFGRLKMCSSEGRLTHCAFFTHSEGCWNKERQSQNLCHLVLRRYSFRISRPPNLFADVGHADDFFDVSFRVLEANQFTFQLITIGFSELYNKYWCGHAINEGKSISVIVDQFLYDCEFVCDRHRKISNTASQFCELSGCDMMRFLFEVFCKTLLSPSLHPDGEDS